MNVNRSLFYDYVNVIFLLNIYYFLDFVLVIDTFCIIIKFFVKTIMNEQEKLCYYHLLLRNHHHRRFIQNRKANKKLTTITFLFD